MNTTLDAQPLLDAIRARGGIGQLLTPDGPRQALRRAYHRAATSGAVTVRAADTLAVVVLGQHPSAVYGDRWWQAAAHA